MKNEKLVEWLTVGSQVAVFAGLGLVAFEINQAHAQLELLGSADSSDNFTQAMETLAQDEDLARLIYTAESDYEALDEFERWRVFKYLDGYFSMSEQDYLVLLGLTEAAGIVGFEDDWKENMARPMYRDYWSSSAGRFTPAFRRFIERMLE